MYGSSRASSCLPASRRRRLAATAIAAAIGLLVTACSGAPVATRLNPQAVAGKSARTVAKYLKIIPAPGTKAADPARGINVQALNGG